MNIPNLPTDNLYKFMALSGLFIFLLSILYPTYRILELQQQRLSLHGEVKILGVEVDHWKMIIENTKGHSLAASDPHVSQLLQLEKALATIGAREIQLDFIESNINRYYWLCWVGWLIGSLLTISGFSLWYLRVQRFQDIMLKQQASKNDKESQENVNGT